jgi:hypothetical protein
MTVLWQRRSASWEVGISLFYLPQGYVRFELNLGRWRLILGRSFKPKESSDEN